MPLQLSNTKFLRAKPVRQTDGHGETIKRKDSIPFYNSEVCALKLLPHKSQ